MSSTISNKPPPSDVMTANSPSGVTEAQSPTGIAQSNSPAGTESLNAANEQANSNSQESVNPFENPFEKISPDSQIAQATTFNLETFAEDRRAWSDKQGADREASNSSRIDYVQLGQKIESSDGNKRELGWRDLGVENAAMNPEVSIMNPEMKLMAFEPSPSGMATLDAAYGSENK